jgi:hypothetical protein
MKRIDTVIAWLAVGACAMLAAGSPPLGADEPNLTQVWSRENSYWRFVKAGDVESYRTLWHQNFIGWPCHEDHPVGKAAIGNWVQEIRDKEVSFDYGLTREGARDFGNIVVVHYRVTMVSKYPDGHVEGAGQESKITHTWMRVGGTWQIIGGMCGRLAPAGT